ncbi:hypothetical protein BHE97_04875 [Aeromicrobium sp. PE09-221]|nr:hypothetical protein BHE97_04875 [Aeromicrobium sp. PE09-221]
MHPTEAPAVARAVPSRRAEFASARACARKALRRLRTEWGSIEIPRRDDGAPDWPDGVVGAISHCDGLHAAAVAFTETTVALGLDVEPALALPTSVTGLVLNDAERRSLLAAGAIDTVGFSLKEALFKAWWPRTGVWLDFTDAEVEAFPDGTAHMRVRRSHPHWPHDGARLRWHVDHRHIRTIAWLPGTMTSHWTSGP